MSKRSSGADDLAGHYLHLIDEYFQEDGRLVDKSINTPRYLSLIASLLPEAPLVWIRRDPLDCAWSCFRTYFVTGNAWTFGLQDIAQHMKIED